MHVLAVEVVAVALGDCALLLLGEDGVCEVEYHQVVVGLVDPWGHFYIVGGQLYCLLLVGVGLLF